MAKAQFARGSQRPRGSPSRSAIIGYVVAMSMLAVLWASVHGASLVGAQKPAREAHDCLALKDDVARLACYDNVVHVVSPSPGRGFAPITR